MPQGLVLWTPPSQSPSPYKQAEEVLLTVLQRSRSQERALALAETPFGVALITTLAVCVRAGMGEQELQQLAERQATRRNWTRV